MMHDSAATHGGGGGASASSAAALNAALGALNQNDQAQAVSAYLSEHLGAGSVLEQAHRRVLVRNIVERLQRERFAALLSQLLPSLRIGPNKSLASFLVDIGPAGLSSPKLFMALLQRFGYVSATLDDRAAADLIGSLLCVGIDSIDGQQVTDFANFVRGAVQFARFLSWPRVIRGLGDLAPDRYSFPRDASWEGLATVLLVAPSDGEVHPVAGLWALWPQPLRQLQVLDGLLSLPDTVFNLSQLPPRAGRKVVTVEDVGNASQTVRQLASQVQASPWNSQALIETLVRIADTQSAEVRMAVTEMLERAVKASAELVMLGLVQMAQPWSNVHAELASKLLSMFLAGHPSHQLVFLRIWQTKREYLQAAFRNFYAEDSMNVTRLLDVAQDLKILDSLLEIRPLFMALDIAALAARREYLNLEKWLQDNINEQGSTFVRACLEFLDTKAKDDLSRQDPQAEQNFMPLTVQIVAIFLRALRSNGDRMAPEEIDYFKVVRNLCLQLHPRLMNLAPGAEGQEPGLQVVTFSQDIHEEADSWYRQMYEEKVGIEDIVNLLRRLKTSSNARDHQLFACMVHTLFDEYRWFEMYYPPRELAMTAIVFGSLIQHQLIDYIPLGIAIRYVLDALRNPPDSNMFKFGLQALLRFQDRLPEWPQLGQALLGLPHVQQSHPEIARMVRAALSGVPPGGANAAVAKAAPEKVPFTAIHVDPLPDREDQHEPDEETSDQVLFIVNNLSPSNLHAKLAEARELIRPDFYQWFSSYLVLQRVSIEPNNHALYTQFLDGLGLAGNSPLLRHVLHETFAKVRMLLNSDKTVQSTNERTLLKNLGAWLGGLTLARNKPIRHRNISFKDLLIQGYDSNRLIVAIPFVCKVLEQCARSTVFKPPNPWLMAVLRLLVELYQFAELKLNLKFEIEVLCKGLNVDLNQIEATTILRKRPQELAAAAASAQMQLQQQQAQQQAVQQQQQLAHLQAPEHVGTPPQQLAQPHQHAAATPQSQYGFTPAQLHAQAQAQQQQQQQQQQPGLHLGHLAQDMERLSMGSGGGAIGPTTAAQRARAAGTGAVQAPQQAATTSTASAAAAQAYAESLAMMLQNLSHHIIVGAQFTLFANNPSLKRMLCMAIERAIREIIAPVVERSVTIATISTRELVTKDFAMEGDDEKMRRAAHQMVQNLAGSLALVTCKDPLRISMVTHARNLFLQSGFTEQTLPEQALVQIMDDNLELACSIIERAAMEKSLPEVDDGLAQAYAARRDHRSRGRGFFWDSQALTTSQYAATLPDLLRLKPDGLQPSQLRVYEDYGRRPRSVSPVGAAQAQASGDVERAEAGVAEGEASGALTGSPWVGGDAVALVAGSGATDAAKVAAAARMQPPVDATALIPGSLTPQQSLEKFLQCLSEVEALLHRAESHETAATLAPAHPFHGYVRHIPLLAVASINREETALAFSQKVIQLLFRADTQLGREMFVILLERLCEVSLRVAKEVPAWLVYAEDERKFNVPVTVALIRAGLINIVEEDAQLAKLITREFGFSTVDFAARLALECLREPACATKGQLAGTIEALTRAAQQGKATDAATKFLEELEAGQLRAKPDVANTGMREQLAYCFAEWVRLSQQSANSEKSFIEFVTRLQTQGILKGEEISSMFFRVCTEVGVDSYIKQKAVGGSVATGIFAPIDAFARLVMLMVKYHADPTGANNEQAKVHYLTKILSIVVLVIAQSHEELGPHFQQKPFFRLFSSLLHDLHQIEGSLGSTYLQALLAIANTLNTLQPTFFPGFTFSWMSLVSHRFFMPKLLAPSSGSTSEAQRTEAWAAFHRLLLSLLRFLAPMLRTAELHDTSRMLYRGALRTLLVLLHDFPDFLAHYHHSLCDAVPTSCIQLRNLILSSFPHMTQPHLVLPDPFAAHLRLDRLPGARESPVVLSDYTTILAQQPGGLKAELDAYLHQRTPASLPASLKRALLAAGNGGGGVEAGGLDPSRNRDAAWGGVYNVPLLNALVLYAGVASIERPQNLLSGQPNADPFLDIVHALLADLDAEGRYLLISAAANQLRWPSSHTAYFSALLLHLFANEAETVREQILRVLLERLIVNRPHPFGVVYTTFEVLRNRRYASLMPKAPPEIQRLINHMRAGLIAGDAAGGGASAFGLPLDGAAAADLKAQAVGA